MLFIDNKKMNESDFLAEIEKISGNKVDLKALKENTSFTYNEVSQTFDLAKLKKGQRVKRTSQGADVQAVFRIYDQKEGMEREIRYAKRMPYADVKNGGNLIYDPKAIDIPSGQFGYNPAKDIDMALYLLVHPACLDSPFRVEGEYRPYRYVHNNIRKESKRRSEKVTKLEDSLRHAGLLADEELKMFAKGLGLQMDKSLDYDDIRSEIKSYAMENPEKYYTAMQSESVKFIGMIQDAIDNSFIISKKIASTTVWLYNVGPNKGIQITSVPAEISNATEYLKTYLGNNMPSHYDTLINMNRQAYSEMNMEQFLRSKKEGKVPEEVYKTDAGKMTVADVVDSATSKAYLTNSHPQERPPSPQNAKLFLEAVTAGSITEDNVSEEVLNYVAKLI